MQTSDYLVIGSGIAGLSFALEAAKYGHVTVVTKRERDEANTRYAQGGIAAVWDDEDSFEAHIRDTHVAGAHLCSDEAVRITVTEGPERVRELIKLGVRFTREENSDAYDLHLEGGHSARRILHAGDITGAEIQRALVASADEHPNITILDEHLAVNLITTRDLSTQAEGNRVYGAYVLDVQANEVRPYVGRAVILATGGLGKVYLYTSNPDVATGDGHAMAFRAGASMANMEFVQFHPTCLFHPKAKNFLISEALRGEGGELIRQDGTAFMEKYHELGSLAPRDIVARAIDHELKMTGDDCVFLDMTHHSRDFIEKHFPNIHARCMSFGVDMVEKPIPVVPAAHYACGGVLVGNHGESDLEGLYAIGEVSCTGLHGANRLASNSLLEGVVYARRAVNHARQYVEAQSHALPEIPAWNSFRARDPEEMVVVSQNWDEIRRFMWNYVGIVRTNKRLLRARARIDMLMQEIHQYYWDFTISRDLIELRNIATVSKLIIESALLRRESRGLHTNRDYPDSYDAYKTPTVVSRRELGLTV
ncbi:MAG: L-aspartate oxidase [Myxococcota bacterium]